MKLITKGLSAIALSLFALSANAGEVLIHGFTWHGAGTYEDKCGEDVCQRRYNGVNPGVSYVFDNNWVLGVYKNSYYGTSAYGAYRHMFTDNFGVFAGYATGYKGHGSGGFTGGLVARTPVIGDGWRIGLVGQPIQAHNIDAVVSVYLSKDW